MRVGTLYENLGYHELWARNGIFSRHVCRKHFNDRLRDFM